jgi:hypothetical protein
MNIGMLVKALNALERRRKHERWTREQLQAYQSKQLLICARIPTRG